MRYQSRNLVVNGLRHHVLEWGEPGAPSVVLLHGGNQTAHSWDLVSLRLARRFHVVAPDLRGHGDTEWPRDCESGPAAMASDVAAIIAALDLQAPSICGHSMGGIVTMTVLNRYAGIARSAVLVDVGPEISDEGARIIGDFVSSIGEYRSVDEFIDRVVAYDPFRSREHIARTARYNLMQRVDGMLVTKHDHRRRTFAGGNRTIERPTLDDVGRMDLPVLVVRGAESNVLAPEAAARFESALPRGRLVTVERCGHNVHSQNTAGFLEVVVPFLEATATPA